MGNISKIIDKVKERIYNSTPIGAAECLHQIEPELEDEEIQDKA